MAEVIEGGDVGVDPSEGVMEAGKSPSDGGVICLKSPSDGGGTQGSVAFDRNSKVRTLKDYHLDEVS